MARFSPDPDQRPPVPSSFPTPPVSMQEEHPAIRADEGRPHAQRNEPGPSFLGRRHLPQARMPRLLKAWYGQLPHNVRYRLELVFSFAKAAVVVVFGFLSVALIISVLLNTSIREPKNAQEVLEKIKEPMDVSYSVETVRVKKIDGVEVRQDSLRGFQVDLERNKLQAQISGVEEETFRILSDGKRALYYRGDSTPMLLCAKPVSPGKKCPDLLRPSRRAVRPVLASDLAPRADRLVTNKATVAGERGWLVTWKPTGRLLLQMLSADLLDLQGSDIEAIRRGKFKTEYAVASIIRPSKKLYQVQTEIKVNGAHLVILATYRKFDTGGISNLRLEDAK